MGACINLNYTELEHTINRMGFLKDTKETVLLDQTHETQEIVLGENDGIDTLSSIIAKMGYDLSEEDTKNVYDEFIKVAKNKSVKSKELDAIIASTALQVAPTFKLKSYVINSGNIISSSAVMVLLKNGKELEGMTVGDGPIDAAFMCIEKIAGRHFELDDFQIQSVTEGREALGVTVVKLRSDGKLYSGKGVSTDIVESSINAYINAINKIYFEEE
jgi:2-isopropylmalate synthase